ncbi:MAG: D-tyrosyl-tRNA(Tyr) deacylase [Candidatus Omnitrophota bacterium]|nr:MAG: D-tyrosyl-tRNA(Tyr) deacylase [Candidatus Omnitrophota bacterium]
MRIVVQRVKSANVSVGGRKVAEIEKGLLIFVGVAKEDKESNIQYLSKKIANLRIFGDTERKMNLSIKDVKGSILSVPQFTLYADTRKGNRPGFDKSAGPQIAKDCWQRLNGMLKDDGIDVKEGVFGAHMEVELVNDGPVTIWLDSNEN